MPCVSCEFREISNLEEPCRSCERERSEREAREMHAQRTIEELRGRLATEESERIRCRDGWAGATNERDALAAKLAELETTAAQQLDATALLEKALAEIERLTDALEHIAAGNISPSISFARRILDGATTKEAHAAKVEVSR